MSSRKTPNRPQTKTGTTTVMALAARMQGLSDTYIRNVDEPGHDEISRVTLAEFRFIAAQIATLPPRSLDDAAVLLLLAYGMAGDLHTAISDRSVERDDEAMAERLMTALAAVLRFVADGASLDLRAVGGEDFISDGPGAELFPEIVGATA